MNILIRHFIACLRFLARVLRLRVTASALSADNVIRPWLLEMHLLYHAR